ncbi:MAG: U32 family peptidase [Candidatus Omnitrophica bacterium]|jgi:collagenase-like PrtC family protease|nr:U32 family peptidase [Candidatus Omnitrophota bacterium]MDD3274490.1 U32 family peptidase [Candidatus Omnitrophota bacterium]MDD5078181.1 U32 family peptidase [Candidatus Omnitrophota bacterium]
MQFAIPTNWQDDFLAGIVNSGEALEIYGKLNSDFFGGGKHSFQLPDVSKKRIQRDVAQMHRYGFKFNYLLNGTCFNNFEWTIGGQKKIRSLLDWLIRIEVDAVTVAIPYLLVMIKKNYPSLRVSVSTLAGVNSVATARYWEDLGADRITLLNTDVNRDFPLLKKIRETVGCQLQLIANVNCLYRCPFYLHHGNMATHSSQKGHRLKGFVIDYCRISCRYRQIMDPVEFIRSPWIRPEDVGYYEDIGIDSLKLIDRGMSTSWISLILKAYLKRKYEGNLIDLFPSPLKTIRFNKFSPFYLSRYFFFPGFVNVFRLLKLRGLLKEPDIYIDNRKLDNFLDFFMKNDCNLRGCRDCGYCQRVARETVRMEEASLRHAAEKYRECLDILSSGKLFEGNFTV